MATQLVVLNVFVGMADSYLAPPRPAVRCRIFRAISAAS
jgi:hypothetical protein